VSMEGLLFWYKYVYFFKKAKKEILFEMK